MSYTTVFSQQVSESELNTETALIEAHLAKHLGDDTKREEQLKACIENDRSNPNYYYQLAKFYLDQDDPRNALTFAEKATKLNSSNKWFALLEADVQETLLDYTSANAALEQAFAVDGKDQNILYRIAHNAYKNGDKGRAIQTLQKIESIFGITERSSYKMLDLYNSTEDFQSGLSVLNNLLKYDSKNIKHLNNLANQYLLLKDEKNAEKVYRKVLAIDPSNVDANAHLVQRNLNQASDSEYLYAITPLIENENVPFDNKMLELIPYVEKLSETPNSEHTQALQGISDRLIAMYPNEAKAHAIRGDIMYLSGELESALKSYNSTLNLNDKVYSVWTQKMNVLFDLNQQRELKSFAEKSIDYYPNAYEGYFWYALACYKSENLQEGQGYLMDMKMVAGGNPDAVNYLTLLTSMYDSKREGKDQVSALVKSQGLKQSKNPLVLHMVGLAYKGLSNDSEADKFYTLAKKYGNVSLDANQI